MSEVERLPTFSQLRGLEMEKGTAEDPQPLMFIRYADDFGRIYELPIWPNCAVQLSNALSVIKLG